LLKASGLERARVGSDKGLSGRFFAYASNSLSSKSQSFLPKTLSVFLAFAT